MKFLGAVVSVLLIVAILASLYLSFGVKSPVDVAQKLVEATNELDIKTVVSCLDPKFEKAYYATSNILGKLIGFSVTDIADLLPILRTFSTSQSKSQSAYTLAIISVEITGQRLQEIEKRLGYRFKGIDNLLGEKATVKAILSESGSNQKLPTTFTFQNFGYSDWRVVEQSSTASK